MYPASHLHLEQSLQHEKTELSGSRPELDDVQWLRGVKPHAVLSPHAVSQKAVQHVRVGAADEGVAGDEVGHDALPARERREILR